VLDFDIKAQYLEAALSISALVKITATFAVRKAKKLKVAVTTSNKKRKVDSSAFDSKDEYSEAYGSEDNMTIPQLIAAKQLVRDPVVLSKHSEVTSTSVLGPASSIVCIPTTLSVV
jgi:hypothetical protein